MNTLIKSLFSFRGEEVAGVDIGADYISCASVSSKENGETIELEEFGWAKKKLNLSSSATASLIKELWQKHRMKSRTVCFALQGPSLLLQYFKHDGLIEEELESALRLEAEQAFQKTEDELYIDWHLYKDIVQDKGVIRSEGILIAIPKDIVKEYLRMLEMAGLYPVACSVGSMAVSNLLLKLREDIKAATCLINITDHNADLSILSGGSYIYPRNLYSKTAMWEDRIKELIEGIKDMLRYYDFKLRRNPIERLVCSGPVCFLKKSQEELTKSINLPIEFWNPLKDIALKNDISAKEIQKDGPMIATAMGLALYNSRHCEPPQGAWQSQVLR